MAIGDADLIAAVGAHRPMIADTVAFVNGHPELAHDEYGCAGHLVGLFLNA